MLQLRMQSVRRDQRLAAQIGPRFFQAVAGLTEFAPPGIRLHHLQPPAQARGQPQGALAIEPAVIEIAGRLRGGDADQAFGLLGCGEQLRHALIGEAIHAYAAVRFAARAQPADGFRSVAPFVAKGIELAFGVAASTHILDDDVVAVGANQTG